MSQPQDRRWLWEITDENRCGAASDLAKLFKNEGVRHPGVLAKDAPGPESSLMAREVIQNSWDAARELQGERGSGAPEFHIKFMFAEKETPASGRSSKSSICTVSPRRRPSRPVIHSWSARSSA